MEVETSLLLTPALLVRVEAAANEQSGTLLELPATNGFLRFPHKLASRTFHRVKRLPSGDRLLAVLRRTGLLTHVCLSPEINDAPDMIRLVRRLEDQGTTVVNMYFHSPTLLEGCSPFTRTAADVETFIRRIGAFLEFANSAGLQSVGMSDVHPLRLGATEVKVLHDAEPVAA